jgi:transcriptional regulator with XRE-family HTH domain
MEQGEQPAGVASRARAGDRLRAAREEQRLTLDEVSIRTRVPKRLLEAIETGDHATLPAPTYSAGFVKAYAQVLGLNQAELSQQFRVDLGGHAMPRPRPEPFAPADPARVPSRLLAFIALAVAILIALSYGVWRSGILSGDGTDDRARLAAGTDTLPPVQPAPNTATDAPLASPTPAPAPAAAANTAGPVVLTAVDTVWLRIYERDGRTLFTGEMPAGQHYEIPADAVDPLIHTGRPEALRITVGAAEIPQLGPSSKRLRDVSLGRDALLARVGAAPAGASAGAAPGAESDLVLPLVPQGGNP